MHRFRLSHEDFERETGFFLPFSNKERVRVFLAESGIPVSTSNNANGSERKKSLTSSRSLWGGVCGTRGSIYNSRQKNKRARELFSICGEFLTVAIM